MPDSPKSKNNKDAHKWGMKDIEKALEQERKLKNIVSASCGSWRDILDDIQRSEKATQSHNQWKLRYENQKQYNSMMRDQILRMKLERHNLGRKKGSISTLAEMDNFSTLQCQVFCRELKSEICSLKSSRKMYERQLDAEAAIHAETKEKCLDIRKDVRYGQRARIKQLQHIDKECLDHWKKSLTQENSKSKISPRNDNSDRKDSCSTDGRELSALFADTSLQKMFRERNSYVDNYKIRKFIQGKLGHDDEEQAPDDKEHAPDDQTKDEKVNNEQAARGDKSEEEGENGDNSPKENKKVRFLPVEQFETYSNESLASSGKNLPSGRDAALVSGEDVNTVSKKDSKGNARSTQTETNTGLKTSLGSRTPSSILRLPSTTRSIEGVAVLQTARDAETPVRNKLRLSSKSLQRITHSGKCSLRPQLRSYSSSSGSLSLTASSVSPFSARTTPSGPASSAVSTTPSGRATSGACLSGKESGDSKNDTASTASSRSSSRRIVCVDNANIQTVIRKMSDTSVGSSRQAALKDIAKKWSRYTIDPGSKSKLITAKYGGKSENSTPKISSHDLRRQSGVFREEENVPLTIKTSNVQQTFPSIPRVYKGGGKTVMRKDSQIHTDVLPPITTKKKTSRPDIAGTGSKTIFPPISGNLQNGQSNNYNRPKAESKSRLGSKIQSNSGKKSAENNAKSPKAKSKNRRDSLSRSKLRYTDNMDRI